MSSHAYGAVGAVFLAGCGWWLTSPPGREREKDLVRILEKQLDRCGPDQLTTPAPIRVHECSLWSVIQICCFGILLGIILTFGGGACFYYKLRQSRAVAEETESVGDEAVYEPGADGFGRSRLASSKRVGKPLALEYSDLQKFGY